MPGRPYQNPEDRAATQPPTQQPAAQPAQPATRPQTPAKPINRTMNRYMDPRARQTGDKPTQTPDVYQKPVGYDVRAGYWQEPQRVARYYHAMQTLPPGTPTQPWMDLDKINQAYTYLQQKNKGSAWYTWDRLEDDDPGNELLAAIPLPPPSAMPEPERKQWYQMWDTGLPQQDDESYYPMPFADAAKTFDAQSLALFPKQGDNVMVPSRTMSTITGLANNNMAQAQNQINPQVATGPHGMPQELYDQLPTWQKVTLDVSPWVGKVVGAATLGLAGLGLAGPVGGAAGLAGGWAMGAALEKGVDPETGKPLDNAEGQIVKAMMFLDVAAEYLERGIGFTGQALDNPGEVFANPGAAWEAGAITYESFPLGSVDADASGPTVRYRINQLGQPEPMVLEIPNRADYFVALARRRIVAGETPEDVINDIKAQLGFSGQIRDTIGHMFLDPLNMLGDVSNAGIAGLARAGKNAPLEAAALSRSQLGTAAVNFRRAWKGEELLPNAGNMLTNDVSDIPRLYGQALRNMTPEDARKFGAVSRWIAGLDETGNVKNYINAEGRPQPQQGWWKNKIDYLRGDTPQARATEVLTHSVDGLQQMINDETDIGRVTAKVQAIAGASPSQVVAALDNDPLPRWFSSAEAQPVTLALRDMRGKVNDLWDRWRTTRDQANIIERVSGMMQIDPYELMAKLHKGTPEEADALYRAFVQRLEKAAAGGDGVPADANAAKILDTLKKDQGLYAMNGAQLRKFSDTFLGKDAAPFGDAQYKGYLFHLLSDGVENWAVKWFGVKPPSWHVRTGTLIKRAQGLVLLGLNPTFLLNNALNNMVTLGWDGLLSLSPASSRRSWLKSMGVSPVRLRAGANAAEIGGSSPLVGGEELGRQIREASRAGDLVQSMDDFARKGDKFAKFAELSQKFEQFSSELAMTNAMRSWWDQFWSEGRAITKMPDDLAAGLDLVDPGLSRKVRRAIARGKSKAEIERLVFKDLGRPALSDVLSPDERALLGHFPGLVDDMESALAKAETPEDIRGVFTDAKARARDAISTQVRQNSARITQEAANRVRIEGGQGLLDMFDLQMQERHDFWLMHFQRMDAAADEAAKLSGARRAEVWRKATEEAGRDWKAYENIEGAKWLGAFEGMGIEEGAPEYVEAMNLLFGMRGNWNDFFQKRRSMMDAFFELGEERITEARRLELLSMIPGAGDNPNGSELWRRVNEGLNAEYVSSVLAEDDLQRQLDDVFAGQYAVQFPDNPNARAEASAWRDAIRDVRRRMVATEVFYRSGGKVMEGMEEWTAMLPRPVIQQIENLTKLTPPWAISKDQRDKISKIFNQTIYAPYVREMLDASNKNAPAPGRVAAVAEDLAQPMPAAPTQTTVLPGSAAVSDVAPAPVEAAVLVDTAIPDVAAVPAGPVPLTRMQEVELAGQAGVFKIASSYGIGSLSPGDRTHILNILKQYYHVDSIGQITPGMARDAFENRALFRGAIDLPAQQALDRKILQYRAEQMRANQAAMLPEPKRFTRDAFYQEARAQLTEDQAGAVAEVVDAIAQHWADERGRTVDDWYDQVILQRGGIEGGTGRGLSQEERVSRLETAVNVIKTEDSSVPARREIEAFLEDDAEPFREIRLSKETWVEEFGETGVVNSAIGPLVFGEGTRIKMLRERRAAFFGLLRPTVERPSFVIAKEDGTHLFVKGFVGRNGQINYMVVARGVDGNATVVSSYPAPWHTLKKEIKGGELLKLPGEDAASSSPGFQLPNAAGGRLDTPSVPDSGSEGNTLTQAQKGVTRWLDNGKAVIHAFEAADVSTMVHEVAHVWLPQMNDADIRTVGNWLRAEYGMELPDGWQIGAKENVQAKEYFARAFERYLAEGRAPVPTMKKVFENFKRWMLSIYGKITGSDIDVKLNDDITGLFDTWLGKKGSATTAPAGPDAWPPRAEWARAHPGKPADAYDQLVMGAIANSELGFEDGAALVGNRKAAIGMRDRLTNMPREDLVKMTRQQITDSVPWEHLDVDPEKYVTDLHRRAIKRMLNETPDEVLKDYPDLYIQKNPQPAPTNVFDNTGPARQQGMFGSEDTPLFSGTPMTARAEAFTPQETVPQGALFDRAEFVPGIEARQVEGESAAGPLFEAPALRSSRDMTDEEYRQVINLAKDWEHLVYNNGGNARKSDLEDWLIKYHGVERGTGHAIANKLTETFSPRLDEWTRTEVRRPPRLEDYPEIAEYLGVKVEPKVEAPAAPPEVPVSTIEPTPIQLNKTAARYIDQAPAELRSLFKRGITLDAQDIESGGIGGPAWTLYQREADKAWRFLRDSNDPNVTRQTDRMGYSFEGGSVVITAPGRKGGEWKAHYTASTDKVASKIEAPASPEMTDAARAAAPEVVPVRGIDPRDALRTALTDYLKANPGVDLDTVGQAISEVDIPGVGRMTFEQAAEQIGLDDLRTAVNDAWTDARGSRAPVDEPLTIQPDGWKSLIQRFADSDPVTPGEFERMAQRLTGQDMNVPANRQAAETALEAGYTMRARKVNTGDVTKDLMDLDALETQRRGARLSVARGVPTGDVPLPLARAARVAAGLLPDDSVVELGAAGRLADGIAGATVLDESQARRAIARALDLKAAVNGQGTVTLARVEDAAGAERALASLPVGGRLVAIAPASIGGTAPRIISPDGKYALLIVDKGSGRVGEPIITQTWAEFAKAIEDLPARLVSPVTPTPNVGQLAQAMPRGETYAYGPSGQRYTFRYRVVPLDELIQSHLDTFDTNPRYPKELQPRNRDRAAYREQVQQIAQNLDERALIETHMVDSGTPVIGGDLIVENGNGRVMGMRRARADYPERWQAYQTRLRERLGIYGLKEDDLTGVKDPILVRERTSDVDRVAFANEAQASQSMQLSVDELASTDAKYIDDAALSRLVIGEEQSIEGALSATANRDLVNAFLNAIPAGEKSAFLAPDGSLSNDGLTRLRNAMFVHVYPGEAGKRLADAFLVSQSESAGNIRAAIFDTLGVVSQAEALVKQGRRAADLTITDDLARAVDQYARLRAQGASVSDFIKQMPLIPGPNDLTPFQMKLLEYIHAHNRSRKKLRELLSLYADNVVNVQQDPAQGSLFGGAAAGKGEILDVAAQSVTGKDAGFTDAAARAASTISDDARRPLPSEEAAPAVEALAQEQPTTPAMGAPLGTMAEYTEPPVEEAMLEGWMKDIEPMLSKAEGALLNEGNRKTGLMDLDRDLDPEQKKALKRYLGQVGADMTDAKLAMMRYGESKRDFALLNYSKRTGADNELGTLMPYEFWYTRSMLNWAARAISRPAILANWARLRNLQEKYTEGEGNVPTRLKKKIKVKIPYLPDWMGGGMFIDPLKQLFPLEQLTRPWEELATQKNMELRKAESVLSQMVEEEEISEAQMQEAMTLQSGPVWEQAVAQARNELDENINNPLDFAFMASGPSLPVSIAWNLMNGNKDKISQLPITRMIQANTAAMGIGGNRGINIEAPLRKATGLPEVDRYEDYRVDRMLANLAADGLISSDDAQRAMIDRAGPAFDMAQKRVSQMGVWQYWGSPLGADMFPEGEKELRDLKTVYDAARAKWAAGDKDALNKFWDAHPEYEARSASFKEPEARLRQYMISEVWDRWNQLPAVHKEQVREQLGPTFTDAFMDKETRAYDTINTTTLASWAQMLGATNPNKAPDAPQINLELAPPEVAAAVERYNQEKDERFPNVGDVLWALSSMDDITRKQVTSTPQMKAYYKWQDNYLANNPDVIPWVTSEKNELYDLPRSVQTAVYSYRTQKEQMFPGIDTVQDQYFAMLDKLEAKYPGIEQLQQSYYDLEAGSKDRKAFLKANPILKTYWDTKDTWTSNFMQTRPELDNYWAWRKTYSAANPEAAPYILSDQTMARGFIGDAYDETVDLTEFSAELLQALAATIYTGEPLRSGAWMELDAMWEEAGQPYGDLEEWVDKAVKPALRQ